MGLNACKKDNENVNPIEEINVSYTKGSSRYYKVTTRIIIDDTTSINNDRDETTLDTMIISCSMDTIIGSETYFKRTEVYKGYTNIFFIKETDSNYVVVAMWDEQEQSFNPVDPYVDINKKLSMQTTWEKPFFTILTEFKVSALSSLLISNKIYISAKVEPRVTHPNIIGKYVYYYDKNGLVKAIYQGKSNISFGTIEQFETLELM